MARWSELNAERLRAALQGIQGATSGIGQAGGMISDATSAIQEKKRRKQQSFQHLSESVQASLRPFVESRLAGKEQMRREEYERSPEYAESRGRISEQEARGQLAVQKAGQDRELEHWKVMQEFPTTPEGLAAAAADVDYRARLAQAIAEAEGPMKEELMRLESELAREEAKFDATLVGDPDVLKATGDRQALDLTDFKNRTRVTTDADLELSAYDRETRMMLARLGHQFALDEIKAEGDLDVQMSNIADSQEQLDAMLKARQMFADQWQNDVEVAALYRQAPDESGSYRNLAAFQNLGDPEKVVAAWQDALRKRGELYHDTMVQELMGAGISEAEAKRYATSVIEASVRSATISPQAAAAVVAAGEGGHVVPRDQGGVMPKQRGYSEEAGLDAALDVLTWLRRTPTPQVPAPSGSNIFPQPRGAIDYGKRTPR